MKGITQGSLSKLMDDIVDVTGETQPWQHAHGRRGTGRISVFDEWESWLYVLRVEIGKPENEYRVQIVPEYCLCGW